VWSIQTISGNHGKTEKMTDRLRTAAACSEMDELTCQGWLSPAMEFSPEDFAKIAYL
jgi:hypothetical protein